MLTLTVFMIQSDNVAESQCKQCVFSCLLISNMWKQHNGCEFVELFCRCTLCDRWQHIFVNFERLCNYAGIQRNIESELDFLLYRATDKWPCFFKDMVEETVRVII